MKPITTVRKAVESVLRVAEGTPRTAVQVANMSGQELKAVQCALSAAVKANRAHNTGSNKLGLYVWGPRPREEVPQSAGPYRATGYYTGEVPGHVRPGSMDFLKAPSVQNGEQIERRRPILIGAPPERHYK
jgi:hypothetical protein